MRGRLAGKVDHGASTTQDREGLVGGEHVDLALEIRVCGLRPEQDHRVVGLAFEGGDDGCALRRDVVVIQLLAGAPATLVARGDWGGTRLAGAANGDPREVHVPRDFARGINHRGLLIHDLQDSGFHQVVVIHVPEVVRHGGPTILDARDQVAVHEVVPGARGPDLPVMPVDRLENLVAPRRERYVVLDVFVQVVPLEEHGALGGGDLRLAKQAVIVHPLTFAVAATRASACRRGDRGIRRRRAPGGGCGLRNRRGRVRRGRRRHRRGGCWRLGREYLRCRGRRERDRRRCRWDQRGEAFQLLTLFRRILTDDFVVDRAVGHRVVRCQRCGLS